MSRHPFGWDTPAGAEHHPDAPWNAEDAPECPECGEPGLETGGDQTYVDYECSECGHNWWVQTGPDPDDARDEARDDALTGDC